MSARQDEAWHLAQLRTLQGIVQAMGHWTQLLEKSATIPYHALLVRLDLPGRRPPLELALTFYPVNPDEVKYTLLLQYFCELPFTLDAAGLSRLRELLTDLNSKTVLGHFGVADGRQSIYYRYVQALPVDATITHQAVADVVVLVGYTPALFVDILEGVASGRMSVDAARGQISARYAELGANS